MRVNYPYLKDPYYEDANSQYSKKEFLKKIDNFINQKQYVKITLLNWNEKPLKDIQGEIVSGTMTKDGSSAVRRTCNLTCSVSRGEYDPAAMSADYSINKKIFLEIGIRNDTDQYKDYPILWFPQGVFLISSFSINSATSSAVNISLGLKDKMSLLDGSISGRFPRTVTLDSEMESITISGNVIEKKVRIYDLIVEIVNHFGNEQISNIVVEDVPLRIGRCIRWNCKDYPIFILQSIASSNLPTYTLSLTEPQPDSGKTVYRKCEFGDDIGYSYEDFVYTNDFTVAANSTITAALDTIKNYLGNFEYFYDEYGIFHFREIKNYLNNSESAVALKEMNYKNYIMPTTTMGKTVYTFSDNVNIANITNTPNYGNIKNDFIVLGTKKSEASGKPLDVMYHLAIDKKPTIKNSGYENILIYKDFGLTYLAKPKIVAKLPDNPNQDTIYGTVEIIDKTYKVPYTLSELKELDLEGKLYTAMRDRGDITFVEGVDSNIFDNNSSSQKKLLNDLIMLTQCYIDLSIDNDLEKSDIISTRINNFVLKIESNPYYQKICDKKLNSKNSLDSNLSVQASILKDATIGNAVVNKICENILNFCGNYVIDKRQTKYDLIIKSLNSQIETCNLLIKGYSQSGTSDANDMIKTLNTEIKNLESQIVWYRSRADIQNIVEKEIEKDGQYPQKEITYKIQKLNFQQWKNKWIDVNWCSYYTGESFIGNYSPGCYENKQFKYEDVFKWMSENQTDICNIQKNSLKEYNYIAKDWRTEIILQGLNSEEYGTDSNSYYYEELKDNWPLIYNFDTQEFIAIEKTNEDGIIYKNACDGRYYFDLIDSNTEIYGEYCVDSIGRRTMVTNSNDINCLFEPDTPNIGYVLQRQLLENSLTLEEVEIQEEEAKKDIISNGMYYCNVPLDADKIFNNLATGGIYNAAFPQIKYDLLTHTNYQNVVSITALPVWYLEPNLLVNISEKSTNTYDMFMIQSISYTLGAGNLMTVNCSKAIEKM